MLQDHGCYAWDLEAIQAIKGNIQSDQEKDLLGQRDNEKQRFTATVKVSFLFKIKITEIIFFRYNLSK